MPAEQLLTQDELSALLDDGGRDDLRLRGEGSGLSPRGHHRTINGQAGVEGFHPQRYWRQSNPLSAEEQTEEYVLASPQQAVNAILPVLETLFDRFAHRFRIGLSELLRRDLEVQAEEPRLVSCSDFLAELSPPSAIDVIHLAPLDGPGFWVVDSDLVFFAVDAFFGGIGRPFKEGKERDFSSVEKRLIQRLRETFTQALKPAWRDLLPVTYELIDHESRPRFVTAINPHEMMVCATFSVTLTDSAQGRAMLVFPWGAWEPVRGALQASLTKDHPSEDKQLRKLLYEGVKDSQVEVRCRLTEVELSLRDLFYLEEGDVILVEIPHKAQLEVENLPLFSGSCGVSRGWRALKIDDALIPLGEELPEAEAKGATRGSAPAPSAPTPKAPAPKPTPKGKR